MGELLVDGDVLLRRQERIEQEGLRGAKTDPVSLRVPQVGQRGELREPLLGEQTLRAVAQSHALLSAAKRSQQVGQVRRDAVEVARPCQVKPIDPRRNAQPPLTRFPDAAPFRFDDPALAEQGPHHVGQTLLRDPASWDGP